MAARIGNAAHRAIPLTVVVTALALSGCGGGGGGGGGGAPAPVTTIELAFTRMPMAGLDPVQVDATVETDGQPATGLVGTIQIQATAGNLGAVTEPSPAASFTCRACLTANSS